MDFLPMILYILGSILLVVLIILGIVCDVISMFMIGSSSFEDFKFITIGGTICFLVGLCLKFFGNFGE